MLHPKWSCVAVLYTLATLHVVQGEEKCEKRSRAVWYNARTLHDGLGLGDGELQAIARLANMKHFKDVLQPIMVPRVVGTKNHARVRQHLVDSMNSLGWTVEEQSFEDNTPIGRKKFTNVIATLNPDAPRRLLLACHYDSKLDREGVFIGATDSAVPCAMMINLATVMKNSLDDYKQRQLDLTLQFVFFDGEEAFRSWSATDSIYGARSLAAKWQDELYPSNNQDGTNHLHRIDVFVLLDLLGTKNVKFYSYFPESERWYSRLVSYERRLNDLQLLNRQKFMFQESRLYNSRIEDDHIPFLRRDVPVLHLIPVPFPSVWHKNSDNASALHYPTIKNLNLIMCAFVADYLHLVV